MKECCGEVGKCCREVLWRIVGEENVIEKF